MKNLLEYVIEANIEKGLDELTDLFKRTMLKGITLSESDFKKTNEGYTLENISKDEKDAEAFINGASSILHAAIHTYTSSKEVKLGIVQTGKDDIFVKLNVEADTNHLHVKISKVFSALISPEIKDKLL